MLSFPSFYQLSIWGCCADARASLSITHNPLGTLLAFCSSSLVFRQCFLAEPISDGFLYQLWHQMNFPSTKSCKLIIVAMVLFVHIIKEQPMDKPHFVGLDGLFHEIS